MQNIRRTFTLLLALIGFLGFAQAGKLPADPRFDAPVKVDVPAGGIALEMYLKAIGYAVKLNVVADGIAADKKINVDFNGKPFRRVWETITTLNDLDFELMQDDIMIVGPSTIVARFRQSAPVTATGEAKLTYTYVVKSSDMKSIAGIRELLVQQFPGASIYNVAETRILVINATASQYAKMSELLSSVDLSPATVITPQAVRRVFKLSNSKAADMAKTIQASVDGPTVTAANAQGNTTVIQTALPTTPGAAPAASTITADVKTTVVADDSSNSLIISGLPEAVEEIAKLIPQLDTRQSMVNVNVRIQEVTNDAALSLGIEWSFGVGNFSGKLLETGVKFLFDSTSALAGFNIGAALNALESQKLSKRINDSNVSVVNNGSASIRSGGRIELNIASSSGNISKTIPFGVQLQVKPRISNDGTIAMDIAAEVSDVQNKGSLDPNRIDFDERKSETTVLMQSGQTVLLGSLLATTQDESTTGIPILSAIPLIGDLFKTRKTNDRQTQLLIVVTANIIK